MYNQSHSFNAMLRRRKEALETEILPSKPKALELYSDKTFYNAFVKDLLDAKEEVIIYSPFVSKFRSEFFKQCMEKLRRRNIVVFIFTRPVAEYERLMRSEITCALSDYEELGASICYLEGSIHEKLAIIDRKVLWDGSLNILSQRASREIMRRTSDETSAMQIMTFLGVNKILAEKYKLKYDRLYRSLLMSSKTNYWLKANELIKIVLAGILTWWLLPAVRVIMLSLKGLLLFTNKFF